MVSVAAAALATPPLRSRAELLAAYDAHVDAMPVAAGVRFERRRAARRFLQRHPDPHAWMRRSTPARLADLHRLRAWPFVSWCFVQRHLVPDLELLLAKPAGVGLPVEWAANDPDSAAAVTEAAAVLGWSANWLRQVRLLAASTICLHTGKRVRELVEADFAAVLGQLDDLAAVSPSARHHARTRLFGLQQACYQLGALSAPPRQGGPVAATPVRHAAGVAQPEIRAEVLRYVTTITTTLRPNTVIARTKALRVFFDYLAEHHPGVTRLDQLERTRHIEPYLAWARGRPWRGKNREAKTIGLTVFHQDVVDLRCFFEDIAGWGWASAPSRRLLFSGDIPRMPDALPRALTPDVDRALMAAVADLDDTLVRTGLRLLRATGMRVGELLDLELDCLLDFDRHGTWLRVPPGKLNSERVVPLEPDTVAVIDAWTGRRGRQRALPHPRHGRPTEFLFLEHGRRPTSFRLRKGLVDAVQAADLRGRDGQLLHITPTSCGTPSAPA
ncbi:MAG TPA: tyrosine-type recombinase/integrase [Pseudonocardiaceae bacterium]|jgi:integrase